MDIGLIIDLPAVFDFSVESLDTLLEDRVLSYCGNLI